MDKCQEPLQASKKTTLMDIELSKELKKDPNQTNNYTQPTRFTLSSHEPKKKRLEVKCVGHSESLKACEDLPIQHW